MERPEMMSEVETKLKNILVKQYITGGFEYVDGARLEKELVKIHRLHQLLTNKMIKAGWITWYIDHQGTKYRVTPEFVEEFIK